MEIYHWLARNNNITYTGLLALCDEQLEKIETNVYQSEDGLRYLFEGSVRIVDMNKPVDARFIGIYL